MLFSIAFFFAEKAKLNKVFGKNPAFDNFSNAPFLIVSYIRGTPIKIVGLIL
jgi:hypothetical protein